MKIARVNDEASFLASLDEAKRCLAACSSIDEAKIIRDKADAVRVWARAQKDAGELEVAAGEIRVRATIRMGELSPARSTKAQAGAASRGGRGREPQLHTETAALSKRDIHVARAIAAVPSQVRERAIGEAKARGEAPTVAGILRAGRVDERRVEAEARRAPSREGDPLTVEDLGGLASRGRSYACIYADPPWSYSNQGTSGTMANHYSGMSVADICALPVLALAADNSHLHLWATSPLLPEALEVMRAWGYSYRSSLIWVKTGRIGMGNYWRVNHEFLLLGVRGKLSFPEDAHDIRSHVEHAPGAHSVKPGVFRSLVERVSPGPRLELFGRTTTPVPGWVVWGNQASREIFEGAASE